MTKELQEAAQKAQEELRVARRTVDGLESQIHHEIEEIVRAAREAATASAQAKYGPALAEWKEKLQVRQAAHEAAQIELGKAATGGLPTGILVEWKPPEVRYSSVRWPPQATGRRAVVEVWSKTSQGRGSYGLPSVGDVVLRVLKKDGTPSVDFVKNPQSHIGRTWFPEGVTPKAAQPAEGATP